MTEATENPLKADPAVTYAVTGVRYGTLASRKRDLFHRYDSYGEPDADMEMAYFFWVIESEGKVTLVDTGFDPDVGRRRGRTPLVGQLEALEGLGIDPGAVATIIVTHFHYDHIGGLKLFPEAEVVVPGRELEFWTSPIASRQAFASHVEPDEIAYVREAVAAGRVRTTEGHEEVIPRVSTIAVGGHSPGQQIVLIATDADPVLLASDAVHFYEELESDRPFGVVADLEAMYRSYDLIRELATDHGALVVPGHDPEVLERYERASDQAPYAVRLGGSHETKS